MLIVSNPEYLDLELTVNGEKIFHRIPTHLRLLDFLRDVLNLTGSKEVCGEGECGACTVIMNGKTVNSCLILAVEADGAEVVTIEGYTPENGLTDLQQSFIDHHSVQCGYCIPGMVLSADQITGDGKMVDRADAKYGLSGNICRCTGYQKIVDAVEKGKTV